MARIVGPQVHELAIFFMKLTPLELGFYVDIDYKYSRQCGNHVDILVSNCPNEQQSQVGLKFATQISPPLNL